MKSIGSWMLILLYLLTFNGYAQESDSLIDELFLNSYYAVESMRAENGIYLDALSLDGSGEKPASIAANGVGLISLCIADAMFKKTQDSSWEAGAAQMADATLSQFMEFKEAGAVNEYGYFLRYFDKSTGFSQDNWGTEYSTIDNAIFYAGLKFCKEYFSKRESIKQKAEELMGSIDFTMAVSEDSSHMYMVLDSTGIGSDTDTTGAFNEYMLVSWIAKNSTEQKQRLPQAKHYWQRIYEDPKDNEHLYHPNYWGYELLSDQDSVFISDFIFQFLYYYCDYFSENEDYIRYLRNSKSADSLWWTKAVVDGEDYEWGLGAGEDPGGGYSANAIDNNESAIVSPHIIAGYMPCCTEVKDDLIQLYENGKGVYSLPEDTSRKILWRYSLKNPDQRCSYLQAIDFSTMLYGLSSLPEYLSKDFFSFDSVPVEVNRKDHKQTGKGKNLNISVNGTKKRLLLEGTGYNRNTEVAITDLQGRVLISQDIRKGESVIANRSLSAGIYFMRIKHEGTDKTLRFLIR